MRWLFCQWLRPAAVPIHKLPSLAPRSELIRKDSNCSPLGGSHRINLTPSKRTRPAVVPIQMYPSPVCANTLGVPSRIPSRTNQEECAYWEICQFGSTARARLEKISEKDKQSATDRRVFTFSATNPSPSPLTLPRSAASGHPMSYRCRPIFFYRLGELKFRFEASRAEPRS